MLPNVPIFQHIVLDTDIELGFNSRVKFYKFYLEVLYQ